MPLRVQVEEVVAEEATVSAVPSSAEPRSGVPARPVWLLDSELKRPQTWGAAKVSPCVHLLRT